jgi:TonB family protein
MKTFMRQIIVFLLFFVFSQSIMAETVSNPYYEKRDCGTLQLDSILQSENATIVYGRYRKLNKNDSLCVVIQEAKLVDRKTGVEYSLKNDGATIAPNRMPAVGNAEDLCFTLSFKPVPKAAELLDLTGKCDTTLFNFYGIDLSGAKQNDRPDFEYEENAEFPGNIFQWLRNNFVYPPKAQAKGIAGKVIVSFTVKEDGSVSEVKATSSPDKILSKAAVELVSKMPKWKPAIINGKPVRSSFSFPVIYRLQ